MKKFNYYFDYSPEVYNYIMTSKILRQSEKNILNDIIDGKTVKELAINYKCSDMAQYEGTLLDKRDFVINYLDRNYKRVYGLKGSVGYVSSLYPNNTLLITMNGHITCSKPDKYGRPTIYDTFDCRDRKVEYVWIVN